MTKQKKTPKDPKSNFSVGLGLLDYINPVFYTITSVVLLNNLEITDPLQRKMFMTGIIISLIGGYIIPSGKLIVGLGLMKFVMPVSIVFFVNAGILLSGLALGAHVLNLGTAGMIVVFALTAAVLAYIIHKTHKFNTAAVLCGAAGYLLIYISLIFTALSTHMILPVILYCMAICLFVFLCFIGIRANLYDARVHWVIEICNVICQGLVALGTCILFHVI